MIFSVFHCLYGSALIAGGVAGFASKGSLPSLIAGAGSGAAFLALEAFARPSTLRSFSFVQGLLAVLLSLGMGFRAARTGGSMPLGVAALSAAAAASFLLRAATSIKAK